MKKVLLIAVLTAVSFAGFAQDDEGKTLSFSIGLEGSMPIGDFGDLYGVGLGGTVQGDYKVAPSFAVTLSAGYLSYSGEDFQTITGFNPTTMQPIYGTVEGKALGLIPVMVGGKYWFSDMFYGHAQAGLSFFSGGGSGSNFSYAPGIGVKFSQIDVSAKYFGISADGGSLSAVNLRVAYNF